MAVEEDLEHCQQGHKQRHPCLPAQSLQGRAQTRRQEQRLVCPLRRLDWWSWIVRAQLQHHGMPFEALCPVSQVWRKSFTLEPLLLPHCKVHVLERQLREWGGFPLSVDLIERQQFSPEYAVGPSVRDNMMHRQEQYVLLCVQTYQRGTQQRSLCQVERPLGLLAFQGMHLRFPLTPRAGLELHHRQGKGCARRDDLTRLAFDIEKGGAQNLMAPDNLAQALLQRRHM